MGRYLLSLIFVAAMLAPWNGTLAASVIALPAVADATLFEESGDLASGADDGLFVGRNGNTAGFNQRRALLNFDFSGLPPGVHILTAVLELTLTRSLALSDDVAVHRVNVMWGEGNSSAVRGGGRGGDADPGSATWTYASWHNRAWPAGGDFLTAASAIRTVTPAVGLRVTWEGLGLISDVQAWLNLDTGSFGWLLVATTIPAVSNAMRFASREFALPSDRPLLRLAYEVLPTPVPVPPQSAPFLLALLAILRRRQRLLTPADRP